MSINTPLNKIPFMNGLSIKIKDIPKYPAFDGKFTEKVDFTLCSMLLEKTNIFSPETISGFNTSVMSKMRNNGNLDVIHNQRFGLGRFYADNNTSLIPQPRAIKHTLFSYCGWLDLDMVKGHGSIALEVFKGILDLPSIRKYVDSFDDIVTVMSSFYKVEGTPLNKDNIKQLFNMMIYGGTPDGWIFKMSQDNEKRALGSDGQKGFKISYTTHHPFVLEFEKECMTMSNMVFKTNTSIVYKIKPKNGSKYDLKDMKNKTISYWFQIIENHIVYIVYELLVTLGYITAGKCGIEYDGLNIPPNGKIINQPLLTNIINDFVLTKTGLNVTFKFKDYGESVLTDLIETRKNMIVATPIDDVIEAEIIDTRETSNEIFNEMVGDFEKTHIKIVSEGVYVRTSGDGFYIMSRQQLINAYEHKQCGSIPFINKWITCNDSINRKDTMGIYPDPSKCPETSFNLWRPFAMETHTKPYTKNIDGLNKILEHFNVMSDYNEESYKYLLGWVAHMIQYPAKKIPCLVLTCLQGGGKTTLILHLTEMMGQKKVWEVTDPKRDIFGDFNGRMLDTFLVNLSEVGFADCKNDLG